MSSHVEGTLLMEGLIEGRLPITPGAPDKLEKWSELGLGGITVSVKIEGQRFSILPSDDVVQVSLFKNGDPSHAIAESLDEMLRIFPPGDRGSVFSTLRSREYRSKQEVQTVYAVAPEGRIAVHQQIAAVETEKPPAPLPRKVFWMQVAMGLTVTVLLLLASSFFVDYKKLFRGVTRKADVSHVAIDSGDFAPYITVESITVGPDANTLVLKLRRTLAYPLDDASLEAATARRAAAMTHPATNPFANLPPANWQGNTTEPATTPAATTPLADTQPTTTQATTQVTTQAATLPTDAPSALPQLTPTRSRLLFDSLARGYAQIEIFGEKDAYIGSVRIRIADLRNKETIDVEIPMPQGPMKDPVPPQRIALVP
jgi:hypothetical protein